MRTPEDHIKQAEFNEALAEFLDGTPYPDWRAVALFYAAVHYTQAYFCSLNPPQRYRRHVDRDDAIQADRHISRIWNWYRTMKDWSEWARYDGRKPEKNDFEKDILPALSQIKKHLRLSPENQNVILFAGGLN